jgi:hypothetical protein
VESEPESTDPASLGIGMDISAELKETIELLLAGGLSAGEVMEHSQFQEVSERALAAGLDVWSLFVQMADNI